MAQNQTLTIAALIFLVGVAGLVSGEAAADDETTNALDGSDSSDSGESSDPARYNCLTKEMWSVEKQAWCDEFFGFGEEPEIIICIMKPEIEKKTTLEKVGGFLSDLIEAVGEGVQDIFDFDSYNIYRSTNQTNSIGDGDGDEDGAGGAQVLDYDSYNIYRTTNQTN